MKLKVLVIGRSAGYFQSPVIYVRIIEYLEYLRNQNLVDFIVVSEKDKFLPIILKWADTVCFNKHSSEEAFNLACLARDKGKHIVYDIDDNIFSWPSSHKDLYANSRSDFLRIIETADKLTIENSRIKAELEKNGFVPRQPFFCIPNAINIEKYSLPISSPVEKKQYIFSAYANKISNFKDGLFRVIRNFHHNHNEMLLSFYGANLYEVMHLPFVRYVPMSSYKNYMETIINSKSLFAITPLGGEEDREDLDFNKCKSPIKYIMYGFACIPGLYSNVYPYKLFIKNGENGLLVDNDEKSWQLAMEEIYQNPDLRKRITQNAHDDIYQNFHVKNFAQYYLQEVLMP